MFQSYIDSADPTKGAERAKALRAKLKEMQLDGFIVPRADEHQGEYVPKASERLAWLTGFTGSAGTAVVLADRAAIFVDGRYTLQVPEQVDTEVFTPVAVMETSVAEWLKTTVATGQRIGFDPWLMTRTQVRQIRKGLEAAGAELVAVEENPIDAVWDNRPGPPLAAVFEQPEALAGKPVEEKIAEASKIVAEKDADAAILTDPASIAWLFNIRGNDIAHTPSPLAFAAIHADGRPELFIDGRKLSNAMRDRLEGFADVREARDFSARLTALGGENRKVLVDPQGSAEAVARLVEDGGGTIVESADPVALPKAKKNQAELQGARAAHVRDGVAMARFLRFVETSAPGSLTEIDAAKALETFRAETAAEVRHAARRSRFRCDLVDRPERRHQPLSRHRANQPPARRGRSLSDRFRRPISGRHHRRHANRADRPAFAREARPFPRPFHPRASRPHRDRDRALPEGDDRSATRSVRAPRALAGRPRLRPRHRPRRRLLSFRARGAAADRQGRPRAA